MFSRTTIASSISRPTHSDSAISVIKLIVKPNAYMNDERADHRDRQRQAGDDGGAPGVQEQEHDQDRQQRALDDRGFTLLTESLMNSDWSKLTSSVHVRRGSDFFSSAICLRTAWAISSVFAPRVLRIWMRHAALAVHGGERGLLALGVAHFGELAEGDAAGAGRAAARDDDALEVLRGA